MINNPYSMKPGEKITPQELFDRYQLWYHFYLTNNCFKRDDTCDKSMFEKHICCEKHLKIVSEETVFTNYFFYLHMFTYHCNDFSFITVQLMIKKFHLSWDAESLAPILHTCPGDCEDYFSRETQQHP